MQHRYQVSALFPDMRSGTTISVRAASPEAATLPGFTKLIAIPYQPGPVLPVAKKSDVEGMGLAHVSSRRNG